MAGLRVIWVGRTQKGFVQEGVRFYLERIRPFQPLACVEVRAADHSGRDPAQALALEGEGILKRLAPEDCVWVLDQKGEQPSTRELAARLEAALAASARPPTFVIGGAFGVERRVKERAERLLSLSRLTYPHQLVRVIFLEQLYRALSLLAGHAYHHD
jgi:23S rRNA (pseudouridine1915-N3)-methyltransferase